MERKKYLDNLRVFVVILVIIYHACYIFNGVGVPGGFPVNESIFIFDAFCSLLYPWFMVLLFMVSGIAARMSLKKRGKKGFLSERVKKLLVPSTIGLFVLHWVTGYLYIRLGGGFEYIPGFLIYPISALSGSGPLWFAHLAFLYAVIISAISCTQLDDRLYELGGKIPYFALFVFGGLSIYSSAQILNMPVITTYRIGIYFTSFLIGYFVLSHNKIVEKTEKALPLNLFLATISAVTYSCLYLNENYASDIVLKSPITNFYAWSVSLAMIGLFKKYFNNRTKLSSYLAINSFGYYVLHYPCVVYVGYFFYVYTNIPLLARIVLTIVLGAIATFTLNEIIKRIPIIRYAVLGIRKDKYEIHSDIR